jgi:hypothetical protein
MGHVAHRDTNNLCISNYGQKNSKVEISGKTYLYTEEYYCTIIDTARNRMRCKLNSLIMVPSAGLS